MKTAEIKKLRIGNIVAIDGHEVAVLLDFNKFKFTITEVKTNGVRVQYIRPDTNQPHNSYVEYERVKPIILTPKILNKCKGFIFHHEDCHNGVIYIKSVLLSNPPFVWGVYPSELGGGIIIKKSKRLIYLHDLQNLILDITGKELKFKK